MKRNTSSIIQVSLEACCWTRGLAASSFGGAGAPFSFDAIFSEAGDAETALILNRSHEEAEEERQMYFGKLRHFRKKKSG